MTAARPSRRRHLVIALALGVVVLAAGGWLWLGEREGKPAGEQSDVTDGETRCGPVRREPVGGAGRHVDDRPITYPASPPSFGDHRSRWEVGAQSFYDADSRPDVAVLVHNLEHGYNILWYDETVLDDAEELRHVQQIADRYATLGPSRRPADAFIAAPWTAEDGAPFPAGMHYALTHWYADPADRTASRADEVGLTRYCAHISPDVVQEWMTDYPLAAAPEGYADLM